MCLVAFAWKSHPCWRLALAGNRDEFHGRPTAPLAVWPGTGILAGRDLRSGGTWVGLGRDGRVAVITNVRDGLPPAFNGLSRGALPVDFLAGSIPAPAHAQALADVARDYAPFNLVLADADMPDTGVGLALERRLSAAFIRGKDYGTRAGTIILVGHDGQVSIHERRFGPEGLFEGETVLVNQPLL